jgi:hypothetical protein
MKLIRYEVKCVNILLFFQFLIASHGNGVYAATGPASALTFAKDCIQVVLAIGLNGVTGTAEQGDSWKVDSDYRIFKRGEQL